MKSFIVFCTILPALLLSSALRPVPWLTEGAILFLEQYFQENQEAKVLEFGSGASTVWLSKKTSCLTSVEHDPRWHALVQHACRVQGSTHVCIRLKQRPYYGICDEFPQEYFHLILIDGRDRVECIKHAIPKLKHGGILMLDNSERLYYQKGIELLKDWKLNFHTQITPDSCGFLYSGWTTSWWIKP